MPLAIVLPPKPIGQMTDAELDAFAEQMFEAIADGYEAPKAPSD